MKNQDSGLMEKEIMSTENPDSPEEDGINDREAGKKFFTINSLKNILNKTFLNSRELGKPRSILILSLIAILLAISISFFLLSTSSRNKKQQTIQEISSPSPEPVIDEELLNIRREVDKFNSELESFDSNSQLFKPPEVDLDIKF